MFLNDKEENIISKFMKNLDKYENEEMTLVWNNENIIKASFDTCFEDENEFEENEEEYEEFTTFVFEAIHVLGEPPVFITEDAFFCVNYHNFPDEILAPDGKKIN